MRSTRHNWVGLFATGPATIISWTSSYSETGALGELELAISEKGHGAYEEAVKQLDRFHTWSKDCPKTLAGTATAIPPRCPPYEN